MINPSSAFRLRPLSHWPRLPWLALATAIFWAIACGHAVAADTATTAPAPPPEIPADITPEQVSDLLSKLTDAQVRAVLLDQLQRTAIAKSKTVVASQSPVEALGRGIATASSRLTDSLRATPQLVSGLPQVWDRISGSGAVTAFGMLLSLAMAFAIGYACEAAFKRFVGSLFRLDRIGADVRRTWVRRLLTALVQALHDLIGIVLFGLVAGVVLEVTGYLANESETLLEVLLRVVLAVRLVALLSRAVLAPRNSQARMLPVDDLTAGGLHWRFITAMSLLLVGRGVQIVLANYGLGAAATELAGLLISATFAAALVLFVLQMRVPLRQLVLARIDNPTPGRASLADHMHLLAAAGVLLVWVLAVLVGLATGQRMLFPGLITLAVLLLLPAGDLALRSMTARWFGSDQSEQHLTPATAEPAIGLPPTDSATETAVGSPADAGASSYGEVALRNLRMFSGVLLAIALLELWGLDLAALLGQFLGGRVATALLHVAVAALLSYTAWSVVETALTRNLGPKSAAPEGGVVDLEGGGAGGSRLETILPLFRRGIVITLIAMIVMIGLSSLGVNIGPLLAGAGVVGIAVGFGAQTLIQDIIAGLFYLMDDAFRVGEYVEMGEIRGTVEGMSIRSLRLRHHNGPIHTVPFGQIQSLTNYSRDWAMMKFELRIGFEADVDKVRKIIKKVGQQMLVDPEIGPLILEPLKSQGVNRMDDSALIIRCKVMTVPGQQFLVRRVAYTQIQRAFEKAGIHFAPKRVIVEAASPSLAAAAASAAATDEVVAEKPADDRG